MCFCGLQCKREPSFWWLALGGEQHALCVGFATPDRVIVAGRLANLVIVLNIEKSPGVADEKRAA